MMLWGMHVAPILYTVDFSFPDLSAEELSDGDLPSRRVHRTVGGLAHRAGLQEGLRTVASRGATRPSRQEQEAVTGLPTSTAHPILSARMSFSRLPPCLAPGGSLP